MNFLDWFSNYRPCMLYKKWPYDDTTTYKVFYRQGNVVRMIFMEFPFRVEVVQNHAKFRQKKYTWKYQANVFAWYVHEKYNAISFSHCVHGIWLTCQIQMQFMQYSHEKNKTKHKMHMKIKWQNKHPQFHC